MTNKVDKANSEMTEVYAMRRLVHEVIAELERIKTMGVSERAAAEIDTAVVRYELSIEGVWS